MWKPKRWFAQTLFQFHKGTIKTNHGVADFRECVYFNSIKVRLKPAASLGSAAAGVFQFHKGTIKTPIFWETFEGFLISIP